MCAGVDQPNISSHPTKPLQVPSEESLSLGPAVMVSSGVSRNGGGEEDTHKVGKRMDFISMGVYIISMEIALEPQVPQKN